MIIQLLIHPSLPKGCGGVGCMCVGGGGGDGVGGGGGGGGGVHPDLWLYINAVPSSKST